MLKRGFRRGHQEEGGRRRNFEKEISIKRFLRVECVDKLADSKERNL